MKLLQRDILLPSLISRLSGGNETSYLLAMYVECVPRYMHQTSFHSLVLRNEETFVIECETWQVNVVMATVNLDYVALSSALPACVCVYREREGAI